MIAGRSRFTTTRAGSASAIRRSRCTSPGGNSSDPWWNHASRKRSERGSKGARAARSRVGVVGPSAGSAQPSSASGRMPSTCTRIRGPSTGSGSVGRPSRSRFSSTVTDAACARKPSSRRSARPTTRSASSSST
ncbi:hypothetical protein BC477_16345 [Clavibacter michiganensis subsp. michiganensis]|nr:hypothetical protein BC477_16345 [Clavibacter michiganensis subsp. michiganensis]